ncbi:MAG: prolyl oligopeptidase family serine peptidase [Candidatus Thiothrix sulfatifontis]|nr:MAG: prolyl oligopeptidase family serine peptidase [Candidatus Thiothrix sulfatifontis]
MKHKHSRLNTLVGCLLAALLAVYSHTSTAAEEITRTLDDQRQYLLYIPSSYQATKPTPLVLFFHGGGGHMQQAANAYGWREKAEQEGFIVAFPNGTSGLRKQHLLATWNAGNCCGFARDEQVDDVGFVKQVLADIKRQVTIDSQRIFATGMSNGGMMSHRLACEMADTFRAIAAVAGTDNTQTCQPSRPIAVLHIHAKDDTHVLFDGGAGEDAFRDVSKVTDFTSVNETISRWVKRNGLNPAPQQERSIPGADLERYAANNHPAQVWLVATETGGHSWPGGKRVRGKQPSRAIDATDFIWRFFSNTSR